MMKGENAMKDNNNNEKKAYQSPSLVTYGDIRQITQTSPNAGSVRDARNSKTR